MIQFEKVSFESFKNSLQFVDYSVDETRLKEYYEMIVLPKRATKASAGYDFSLPFDLTVFPKESILVPTGIKVRLEYEMVCLLMPRSSFGMKYGMQLDNTVGVIDADYYFSDNEGHIMARLTFNSITKPLTLKAKERFMQGLIISYHITDDDAVKDVRNGGFGSTGR